jgi:predicted transposase/invertase (TIGR01784 family)
LNPILDREFEEDRLWSLDIKARDADGKLFNIEVQTTLPAELPERLAYYACSMFVGQLSRGDEYDELRPAIGICVLDGILLTSSAAVHSDFRFPSIDSVLTDHLQIHLLELPKYDPPSDNRTITHPIDWEGRLPYPEVEYIRADYVPGPATLALMALMALGAGVVIRRRRSRR